MAVTKKKQAQENAGFPNVDTDQVEVRLQKLLEKVENLEKLVGVLVQRNQVDVVKDPFVKAINVEGGPLKMVKDNILINENNQDNTENTDDINEKGKVVGIRIP